MRSIQVVNVRWFNATAWYGMYLSRLCLRPDTKPWSWSCPTFVRAKGREWNLPIRSLP